ncbi:MAG: pyridoxal phosphate-dependent aminotransferase [Prevotellaceae bacterium]|jgi:cystathionine beta-lyase|nr:pyridoxal phosphate-dependent aminotransferase [Prevotellaceae bacterium]
MIYNFDEIVERRNTNCEKWDNCIDRFGTNDVLPLWVADMDFKTPDFIINALKRRLEHEIFGYHIRPKSFYTAVHDWLQRRGWEIDTNKISFSPGVVPAINFAVNIFTSPGDKILINTPVYHPFMYAINNAGRTMVRSSLVNSGDGYYTIDFDDFERKLSDGVKMFIFCSPHNPVGRVWTLEELTKIGELCLKYNVLIVSDEIHSDLVFKPHRHTYFASISKDFAMQTITFVAPSKTFNLAGLFSSIIYSDNPDIFNKFNSYVNRMSIGCGTVFGDIALEAAYTYGEDWLNQLLKYLEKNFEYVIAFLEKNIPKIKTVKPEGTYLMWLNCSELGMTSDEIHRFMVSKAGLAMNPGKIFGSEGELYLRLNVATPRSNLEKAMQNMLGAFKEYEK